MATPFLRSSRSSKVPQAASSLAVPPEPPAELAAAKDRGSYTALPVVTSWPPCPRRHSVEPPLTPPSAAMLSAPLAAHDSESTRCMEC
jgi:hypothetical protein